MVIMDVKQKHVFRTIYLKSYSHPNVQQLLYCTLHILWYGAWGTIQSTANCHVGSYRASDAPFRYCSSVLVFCVVYLFSILRIWSWQQRQISGGLGCPAASGRIVSVLLSPFITKQICQDLKSSWDFTVKKKKLITTNFYFLGQLRQWRLFLLAN